MPKGPRRKQRVYPPAYPAAARAKGDLQVALFLSAALRQNNVRRNQPTVTCPVGRCTSIQTQIA